MLLEPELVEIKKEIIGDPQPKFFLRPNRDFEELARRLEQNDPSVAHLQGTVSPAIIQKIKSRELIQLDPTSVSAIQVLTDASAERGTPPYQRLFVNYTFEDFVRLALMSQAQRYHFPVELWTIGNAEKGIWPTPEQLERFREMVQQAVERPPFSIFFPPIVEHQVLGVKASDGIMDVKENMAYAQDQYMIGLGVNKDMILGATSMFSSNESSGNQMFVRMMQTDRDDLENWMKWHFFEPLAQWNNLKVEKNGILVPILPDFEWEHPLDFKAQDDERKNIKEAYKEGLLDPATWIETVLNRNPEDIKERIRKEIGGVLDNGKMGGAAREEILKSLGRAESKVENPGQEAGMGAEGTEEAGGGGEIPAGAGAAPEAAATPAPAEAGAAPEAPPTE